MRSRFARWSAISVFSVGAGLFGSIVADSWANKQHVLVKLQQCFSEGPCLAEETADIDYFSQVNGDALTKRADAIDQRVQAIEQRVKLIEDNITTLSKSADALSARIEKLEKP